MSNSMDFYNALLAAKLGGGSGGGGFSPTQAQLDAMNSGITAAKLTQDESNISSGKAITDRIVMAANETTKVYIQATEPTGTIPEGSIWIDTAVSSE